MDNDLSLLTTMEKKLEITLVVPAYNEAKRIGDFLAALEQYKQYTVSLKEVRIVSDGSTDNTVKILTAWKRRVQDRVNFNIRILSYKQNRGRGYAVRTGLSGITTDLAVYIDGDLDIPLPNIERVVRELAGGADLVLGSKKIPGSICTSPRKLSRMIVGYGHSILAYLILGIWHWDWQGGIKGFRRETLEVVLPNLTIDHWGFDMEVAYLAQQLGNKLSEIPLVWGAKSNDSRVKLGRDIVIAIRDMWQIRRQVKVVLGEVASV